MTIKFFHRLTGRANNAMPILGRNERKRDLEHERERNETLERFDSTCHSPIVTSSTINNRCKCDASSPTNEDDNDDNDTPCDS
jgi:hypothetical protein